MAWINETVEAFGRDTGMEGLQMNPDGILTLHFENAGNLYVEQVEHAALVYLAQPLHLTDQTVPTYFKALTACHYDHSHDFPLNVALHSDQLIYSFRIPERAFTLDAFHTAFDILKQMHQDVHQSH